MKLGARMLKTGIAITLALYVSELLHLPTPVFAGIAAIFAIQPTIYRSYLSVIEQIQGNIIGAILAIIFILIFGNHTLIVGFAAILAIIIMVTLKLENSIRLALVTIIAIMTAPANDFLHLAILRPSTILLGILSAFVVNFIFLPPKYETKLFQSITDVNADIFRWMRLTSRFASEWRLLRKDLGSIKNRIKELNQLYSMYKEERNYFQKHGINKMRKLVIYRQMIHVTEQSHEILTLLQRHENILQQISPSIQMNMRDHLDFLLSYHEQLLLKYVGKVRQEIRLDLLLDEDFNRVQLIESLIKEIRNNESEDDFEAFHLMRILSALMEYEEHLEKLERLIRSSQKFHQKEVKKKRKVLGRN
ncbi:MAG TPA: aromatic acid exporter family protein [Bacillaceae bacterium]|nr:aromatic acid exporter family protein [Bacillaceae bacterium]